MDDQLNPENSWEFSARRADDLQNFVNVGVNPDIIG